MKSLRPVLLAFLLVLTFYFVTTRMSGPNGPSWVTRPSHVELTEAAGPSNYDAEEQNNIAVYKKALPAVVNITSTAVTYDFFYGAVPQQGMGSGFVIDAEGHILIADIGHWESEQFTPELLRGIIEKKLPNFALLLSETKTNPVNYFF